MLALDLMKLSLISRLCELCAYEASSTCRAHFRKHHNDSEITTDARTIRTPKRKELCCAPRYRFRRRRHFYSTSTNCYSFSKSPPYSANPMLTSEVLPYDLPDLDGSFQCAHNTEFTSAQPSDVAAKVASKRYPTSVSVIVIIFNAIPSIKQDAPLQEWSGRTKEDPGFREEFLSELLRLEGRGDARQGTCMTCKGPCGVFRCDDCFGGRLECSDCCLARHKTLPLHILCV